MIQINASFLIGLFLAIGAVGMGAFANDGERRAAVLCASFLMAVWALSCATYLPAGPTQWLQAIYTERGLSMNHLPGGEAVDIWALSDLVGMIFILLIARDKWWGILLYGLLLAGSFCHVLYWLRLVEWGHYRLTLDLTFYAEEAVFFAIGGRGAVNAIGNVLDRRRSHLPFQALAKARSQAIRQE